MSDSPGKPSDRRTNLALRELVDEMMVSIRAAAQGDLWTPEERAQYERELANIMGRVKIEAVSPTQPPEGDAA
jgi:hypothetical protein